MTYRSISQRSSTAFLSAFYCEGKRNEKEWSMRCRICGYRIRSKPGVTSNFHRHIKNKHRELYATGREENHENPAIYNSPDFNLETIFLKNEPLSPVAIDEKHLFVHVNPRHQDISKAIFNELVVGGMYPTKFINSEYFKKFLIAIEPHYVIPNNSDISEQISSSILLIKTEIKNNLEELSMNGMLQGSIHATINVWNGQDAESLIGVKFSYFDAKFTLVHKHVAFRYTTMNVEDVFQRALLENGFQAIDVGSIVMESQNDVEEFPLFEACPPEDDLESLFSVEKKHDLLESTLKSTFRQMPCMVHELYSAITDALKRDQSANKMVRQCQDVVKFCYGSSSSKEAFLEILSNSCSKEILRWNIFSKIRHLSQINVWNAVNKAFANSMFDNFQMDVPEFNVAHSELLDLVSLLEPFEEAILALQNDDVTSSRVIPALLGIDSELSNIKTRLTDFHNSLHYSLYKRFHRIVCRPEYVVSTLLDCRFKILPFSVSLDAPSARSQLLKTLSVLEARDELRRMMNSAVVHVEQEVLNTQSTFHLSPDFSADNFNPGRKSIFAKFTSQSLSEASEEALYLRSPTEGVSPDLFWARQSSRSSFPQLHKLAHHLLGIPASSGNIEKLNSTAESFKTGKRNGLDNDQVESVMLLKYNTISEADYL